MKKTYITRVPDHIGAFLQASKCFASLGMNITRTSYNKAVDSNIIFIDAEGTQKQHEQAHAMLKEYGFLREQSDSGVVLLEFTLQDVPGTVVKVLEKIQEFSFNISYISSQEDGSDVQHFKMGLFVDDSAKIKDFIDKVSVLCPVRIIDYNSAEKNYDNSIFYNSFVNELTESMNLGEEEKNELLINANLAMQTLDEAGLSPYKTFDSISKFATLLSTAKGDNFSPRITKYDITENTTITLIEPKCGSNTAIIKSQGKYLFVDCGYACYKEEMLKIFRDIIPGFDNIKKQVLITHADLDHCGLLNNFDEVITNSKSGYCLTLEYNKEDSIREQNPLHRPYIKICKTLTSYNPVNPDKLKVLWQSPEEQKVPLVQIGFLEFGDLNFEVYEGYGGHMPGEIILVDYDNKIVFTGDVFVNIHGMTPEQYKYNKYAPVLMTSVDTDKTKCALERDAIFKRLGIGKWQIFGAHGAPKDYEINNK